MLYLFHSASEFQTDLTVENTGPKICAQIPQSFKINCSESGKPPECVLMITPIGEDQLLLKGVLDFYGCILELWNFIYYLFTFCFNV